MVFMGEEIYCLSFFYFFLMVQEQAILQQLSLVFLLRQIPKENKFSHAEKEYLEERQKEKVFTHLRRVRWLNSLEVLFLFRD